MFNDIITVLSREFSVVNDSIQEKLSPGELYVTITKPDMEPMVIETYIIDWMYEVNFTHTDPQEIEDHIKKIINALEEGFSDGRFKVMDIDIGQLANGTEYIVTVTFMVAEEIIIT